jgi:hypothetical protein
MVISRLIADEPVGAAEHLPAGGSHFLRCSARLLRGHRQFGADRIKGRDRARRVNVTELAGKRKRHHVQGRTGIDRDLRKWSDLRHP